MGSWSGTLCAKHSWLPGSGLGSCHVPSRARGTGGQRPSISSHREDSPTSHTWTNLKTLSATDVSHPRLNL